MLLRCELNRRVRGSCRARRGLGALCAGFCAAPELLSSPGSLQRKNMEEPGSAKILLSTLSGTRGHFRQVFGRWASYQATACVHRKLHVYLCHQVAIRIVDNSG